VIPLGAFFELTKYKITSLATLSAATGYILFTHKFQWGLVTVSLGVLLIAQGASALNQWQEKELDATMERTRRRPLPAGILKPGQALAAAVGLSVAGLTLLWLVHNHQAALLALLALIWYNGLYTYLKRVTPLAVIPGAVIGALPPAIGWTAAGGGVLDPQALSLSFFFFMWQVPHFWLLLFIHRDDYQKADLPTLLDSLRPSTFSCLIFIWMLATGASSLLLPLYGLLISPYTRIGLLATGFWIVCLAAHVLRAKSETRPFQTAFRGINLYALLVMSLLVLDSAVINTGTSHGTASGEASKTASLQFTVDLR